VFVCIYSISSIMDFILPFLRHAVRPYRTFYDLLIEPNPPLILTIISKIYSAFGLFVFIAVLAAVYITCYKKHVAGSTWVLLSVLTFLTFFPASHVQFLLWTVFPFTLFYLKHAPDDPKLTQKFILIQAIAIGVHFMFPFMQFLYLYFIFDIIRKIDTGTS
jgi:hypothetical protein